MVDKDGLHGNKHIVSMYLLGTFLALLYLRCYSFAGMTNAFQSELINFFIQRFMSAQFHGDNFIEQVAAMVEFKDEAGRKQKIKRKVQKISLKTGSPMESHTAAVLTLYAFSRLEEELVLAP